MKFDKVTPEHIRQYRNDILKSSSASTFDRKIFSLKKFFEWAVKEGFVDENPVEVFLKQEADAVETKVVRIEKQKKTYTPSYGSLQSRIIAKLAGKPKIQKIIYNVFYTRPKWYQTYHSLPIASYFNYAILVILMSGLGFGIYTQFFKTTSTPLAYPTSLTRAGRYLSFQGRLTNILGNPITSATNVDFKLYNASASGTLLWDSGVCSITPDTDGIFSTLLGSSCGTEIAASVFSENAGVWLGVTVGADIEASPRVQIATVAYALNSETLQGYPASAAATANTVPVMNNSGQIVLAVSSPKIQSTSGNFAVEGQAITLDTPSGSNGSINIAPDGTGSATFTFSGATPGNGKGMLYATDANLNSKALIYGSVTNDSSGYNLLELASGTTPRTKFAIDSAGNATLSGSINGLTISGGNVTSGGWTGSIIGTQYGGTGADNHIVAQYSVPYYSATGVLGGAVAPSTAGYVLSTNSTGSAPTWIPTSGIGTNYWQLANHVLAPSNALDDDLAVGGNSTASAKLLINAATGNLTTLGTASVSGNLTLGNGSALQSAYGPLTLNYKSGADTWAAGLTLTNSGSVGIGTTTPTAFLNVVGPNAVAGAATPVLNIVGGTGLTSGANGTAGSAISLTTGNGGSGTVGGSAGGSLSLIGGVGGTGSGGGAGAGGSIVITGGNGGSGSNGNGGNITINPGANGGGGGTNGNIILANLQGNVGIGTASPAQKLDVNGNLNLTGYATMSASLAVGNVNAVAGPGNITAGGTIAGKVLTQNGNTVCDVSGNCSSIGNYWQLANHVLAPANAADYDLAIGGNSTASAKLLINAATGNLISSGNASISGSLTFAAGAGSIQSTNKAHLTLGGTTTGGIDFGSPITSGTWNGSAIGAIYGGTGQTVYAIGDILYADTTTSLAKLSDVATGNVLISGGTNTAPSWGKVVLGTHTTGNYVSSINGTANQISANVTTGDVTLSIPSDFRAPGTVNAVNGLYTGATAGTQRIDASGNLVNIGNISASGYATISGSLAVGNVSAVAGPGNISASGIIAGKTLTQNGNTVCDASGNCSSIGNYWQLANHVLAPANAADYDLAVGGNSTASAKLQIFAGSGNLISQGNASISGSLTFRSGAGSISTTTMSNLTLGGSTTGNVILNSRGSTALTANGVNLTVGGILYLANGTTYYVDASGNVVANGGTFAGDVAVNGADLTTTSTGTATLFNTNATTLNVGGAASTLAFGAASSATTFGSTTFTLGGNSTLNGGSASSGTMQINSTSNATKGNLSFNGTTTYIDGSGNLKVGGYATASASLALGNTTAAAGPGHLNMSGNLTVGGTINGLSISSGTITNATWNGNLITAQYGGTGANNSAAAQYSIPYYSATGVMGGILVPSTDGYVLTTHNTGSAPTWTSSASLGTNYWKLGNGTVSPFSDTLDVLIGNSATTSAKFAFKNVLTGTPTASISGSTANVALYLDGNGNMSTTNMANLTLGSSTTGNIILNSRGSTALTANGANLTAAGIIYFANGTTYYIDASGNANLNAGTFAGTLTANGNTQIGDATSDAFTVYPNTWNLTNSQPNLDLKGATINAMSIETSLMSFDTSNTRVGIGTTSPTSLLDVAGAASVSGSLSFRTGAGSIQTTAMNPLTIGGATSGNITLNPSNAAAGGFVAPNTTNVTDLGTASLLWRNVYATSYYQGVNQVCDISGNCTSATDYWSVANGVIYPKSTSVDLLLGSNATSSAKFAFLNVLKNTPTASISGSTANVALFMDGNGNISTTNRANLTLGNSATYNTTGNILLNPNGTGNVGIGNTSTPIAKLQVIGDIGYPLGNYLYLNGGGAALDNSWRLGMSGATAPISSALVSNNRINLTIGSGSTDGFVLGINGSNSVMEVNGSGTMYVRNNLGIGTTTPTALLDAAGDASASGALVLRGAAPTIDILNGYDFNIQTSPGGDIGLTSRLTILNSNGNVGIGTAAPQQALDVNGYIRGQRFVDTSSAAYYVDPATATVSAMFAGDASMSGSLVFNAASINTIDILNGARLDFQTSVGGDAGLAAKMTLLNNGYLGIGTVTPNAILDIAGDASTSGSLVFKGTSPSTIDILNGNRLDFQTSVGGDTGLSAVMTILNNGNVGIGTISPTTLLGVGGTTGQVAYFATGGGINDTNYITVGGRAHFGYDGNNQMAALQGIGGKGIELIVNDSTFGATASAAMVIKSTGLVGIGTTSPQQALDVNGYIRGQRFIDTSSGAYYIDPAAATVSAFLAGNIVNSGAFSITTNGSNGSITIDAGSGDVIIGDGSTSKLNAGTIDPPYTINGSKYATYVSSMTGVKEETTGTAMTSEFIPGQGYRTSLDFANAADGSDLWVFSNVTKLSQNANKLVVLLSPAANTKAWYSMDPSGKLYIYTSQPTTVSYRLTAPRFDAEKWQNTRDNGVAGFTIDNTNTWPALSEVPNMEQIDFNNYDLVASAEGTQKYNVVNSITGQLVQDVTELSQAIIGNIKAGVVVTKDLASNTFTSFQGTVDNMLIKSGLVAGRIQTKLISPLADSTDVTVQIGSEATPSGKFAIQNSTGNEVASIDNNGNATFSGTLYADQINSKSLDDIQNMLTQVKADQDLLAQASNWSINSTNSASLNQIATADLYVTNQAAVNSLSVTNSLTIGTDMVFGSSLNGQGTAINSLDTLTSPLKIQSLAMAPVEIMAGLIKIDTKGNVEIAGNLAVAGNVESAGLTLKDNINVATNSANLLTLQNSNGNTVSTVDASGSATFNNIMTQGLTIAGATANATSSSVVNGVITTNATAGSAVIPAGTSEITIKNNNVTDYTLVYVTPTSSTNNYVLYVKSKGQGQFVVGFTNAIDADVNFNWWIVKVSQ